MVHVVWSTRDRRPTIGTDGDARLARSIRVACARVASEALAVGNADDHVHVLLALHPATALAEAVQRMKGTSLHDWNLLSVVRLRWQTGYWARTLAPEDIGPVIAYVNHQRMHHRTATIRPSWEQTVATVVDDSLTLGGDGEKPAKRA